MADQDATVPVMDDRELFNASMADEPASPPTAETPPQTDEQPRDEQGRFAPKAKPETEEQQPVQAQEPAPAEAPKPDAKPDEKDDGGNVPSWRLRELREERDTLRRTAQQHETAARQLYGEVQSLRERLAKLEQPAAPAPDMFENPQGFVQYGVRQELSPIQQELAEIRRQRAEDNERWSRTLAVQKHGEQAVNEAYAAIHAAARANSSEVGAVIEEGQRTGDPVGALMRWHTNRAVISKVGNDPMAWFKQTLAEAIKNQDPDTMAILRGNASPTQPNGAPIVSLPPSINRATGSGASQVTGVTDGDMTDASLFRHAMSAPRRGR